MEKKYTVFYTENYEERLKQVQDMILFLREGDHVSILGKHYEIKSKSFNLDEEIMVYIVANMYQQPNQTNPDPGH